MASNGQWFPQHVSNTHVASFALSPKRLNPITAVIRGTGYVLPILHHHHHHGAPHPPPPCRANMTPRSTHGPNWETTCTGSRSVWPDGLRSSAYAKLIGFWVILAEY